MRPQNPQVISLIEGNNEQTPVKTQGYPLQYQNQQIPTTLPITVNKIDYPSIIAIVGIIGLLGLIALLAYLKR
jgi:hypothetical protein